MKDKLSREIEIGRRYGGFLSSRYCCEKPELGEGLDIQVEHPLGKIQLKKIPVIKCINCGEIKGVIR